MLTAEEFAEAINVPYPTVALWLRQEKIKGAERLEFGGLKIWQIPASVIDGFERPARGRRVGSKDSKKRAKKMAGGTNGATLLAPAEMKTGDAVKASAKLKTKKKTAEVEVTETTRKSAPVKTKPAKKRASKKGI